MTEKKNSLDEAFKTAVNFHAKGNVTEAKNIFEKILEARPEHFLTISHLGIICAQLKKFNEAIKLFDRALKINPNYAEGHNNLGNVLFELSEFEKSLECYKKAVKLNPNFSDAFNNLGNVYQKKENLNCEPLS